jgi:HD-GYP domain-containing protein (c-di-GMP phosphodiesterase class II)
MEITASDGGTLYMLEDDSLHFRIIRNKTLGIHQSVGDTTHIPPVALNAENVQNVCAYSAIYNEVMVIDDVYVSERFNFSGPKNYDKLTGYRTCSMLTLPLSTVRNNNTEVLGVLQLLNATGEDGRIVPYQDIMSPPIIPALANVAANTLTNLVQAKEIRTVFQSFVAAMVRTIDERSRYNSNHTQKVTKLCESFALHLSTLFPRHHDYYFTRRRIEELTMAAMLHDIGKLTTPISIMDKADRLSDRLPIILCNFELKFARLEVAHLRGSLTPDEYRHERTRVERALEILLQVNTSPFVPEEMLADIKTLGELTCMDSQGNEFPLLEAKDVDALSVRRGTLTEAERQIMQEHADATGRILSNIAFGKHYANVTNWAQSHHEFLDGTGYPRGLSGDELPLEVRIVTIMDIFEALTAADRPYKKAMPVEKAFGILFEMAEEGKLHAELVKLFYDSQVWLDLEEA